MDKIIVGIGEILWDMLPDGKRLGGAPANFAWHASQAGVNSCVVSAIGKDEAGDEILHELNKKGLPHRLTPTGYPTGTVGVELDSEGIPCYHIHEQVAWDYLTFTPELESLAARTCAVCFGSLAQRHPVSREAINRFLDAVPDGEGQYKIFDMNLRQQYYNKKILEDSLTKCNVLKLNEEELLVVKSLFGYAAGDRKDICRKLLEDYCLQILILTCGTDGSYIITPDTESFCPTPRVEVRDTVGAGDSFTATFCTALIKGLPLREAHRRAVETSAYVCTCDGAMPVIPDNLKF